MRHHRGQDYTRYKMREKLISIGDDFWIENDDGDRVFKVDGKAVRVRDTLEIKDRQGNTLCKIQERKVRVKDTMKIESADGQTLATVKKALISPVRDRFSVDVTNGPDWDIKGNILDHEYKIKAKHDEVAEVSRKWFRVRDTYGVDVFSGQQDALVLAVTVALDSMTQDD